MVGKESEHEGQRRLYWGIMRDFVLILRSLETAENSDLMKLTVKKISLAEKGGQQISRSYEKTDTD